MYRICNKTIRKKLNIPILFHVITINGESIINKTKMLSAIIL